MSVEEKISRRRVLGMSLAVTGITFFGGARSALAQALKRTSSEIAGPFYPNFKLLEQDADLTIVAGRSARAQGQVIHLMGRVLNLQGEPVSGAKIKIWQANTHGRYAHPRDRNPATLDPNFQGSAVQVTDVEGRYRFKTIKPGAYPASPDWLRPPHIHFEVISNGSHLVTQMYFPGEPMNEQDLLLQGMRANQEGAIATLLPPTDEVAADSLIAVWDIVLDRD